MFEDVELRNIPGSRSFFYVAPMLGDGVFFAGWRVVDELEAEWTMPAIDVDLHQPTSQISRLRGWRERLRRWWMWEQ